MVDAVGPVYAGRFEEFIVQESGEEYTLMFLADRNNEGLQAEGKPPVYYWVPGEVRLARHGDTGPYKFRHIHFVGVMDEDTHVGVDGQAEVVGGLMAMTTTSRFPTSVLQQATEQLLDKFRGDDDRYWGWRTSAAPRTAMTPITSNITAVTNLSPGHDGTAPTENVPVSGGSAPTPGGATPDGAGRPGRSTRSLVRPARPPARVIHGRTQSRSSLDAWAFDLQGQGPGSVTGGENAYSGLMGAFPSELVWAGFHGGFSPMVVAQQLIMPMWSQEVYLKITGSWERIFNHFSAHANARYLWASADVRAEFNQLRISGDIQIELAIDGTTPQGEEAEQAIEARIDLIVEQFTNQAAQVIFEPPMPTVEPAEAPSGGALSRLFGGGGVALRARRDQQQVDLSFEETRFFRYNQPTTISSSLTGLAEEIEADPAAEARYFQRLVMGDLSRKVTRIVKPVVRWSDPARDYVGQPVSFMSAQIGYPDENGVPVWSMETFQSTDSDTNPWSPAFARRDADEVSGAPDGWTPDKTFVRRKVHLQEPPGSFDNPFVHMSIEQNEVDLDDGPHGTLSDEGVLEVRADRVGVLEVGPISLGVVLADATQVVEVTFFPKGRTLEGTEREPVRFQWRHDDQDEPRFLKLYTGDKDYQPDYDYEVRVIVRGSIFSPGMEWTGDRLRGTGNGPLMLGVPPADSVPTDRVVRHSPRQLSVSSAAVSHTNGSGNGVGAHSGASVTRPPGVRVPTPRAEPRSEPDGDGSGIGEGGYDAEVGGFELGTRTSGSDGGRSTGRSSPGGQDDEAADEGLELVPGFRPG